MSVQTDCIYRDQVVVCEIYVFDPREGLLYYIQKIKKGVVWCLCVIVRNNEKIVVLKWVIVFFNSFTRVGTHFLYLT